MAQNKNALIRYRTIDRCLRNTGRRWTLQDLVDACSDALYELEGKWDNVGLRTIQRDIEFMRSDKLGYEAPIEVYDRKYYRYSDPDYSISNRPLSEADINALNRTIDLLRQFDEFDPLHEMADVVNRLQDKVAVAESRRKIVDFEHNSNLKGLSFLNPLYDYTARRTVVEIAYQSFRQRSTVSYIVYPHLLKEYNNRWFLICTGLGRKELYTLALDRIESVSPVPHIIYKDNPRFTEDYYDDVIGVTKYKKLKKATVTFTAFAPHTDYILTKPFHSSQRLVTENPDGSMTFELVDIVVNPELKRLLLGYGPGLRVEAPESLAQEIKQNFRAAAERYS